MSILDPNQAIRQLVKDPDWTFKVGVGGIFNALSLVVLCGGLMMLPASFCCWALNTGYILRVMRSKMKDPEAKLPDWNDWLDLFISGMSWLAIAYGFVMVAIMFYFTVMSGIMSYYYKLAKEVPSAKEAFDSAQTTHSEQVLWVCAATVALILLACVMHFFSSILKLNFARKETMRAGFAYFEAFKIIKTRPSDFLFVWLLSVGLLKLAIILPTLTVLGVFFVPSVFFAAQIVTALLYAQLGQGLEDNEVDEVKTVQPLA
ncbi:MAG: DUF4013 domain-containing protein [Cyanobacteria bacterium TGS_CYA1]|nr:DUF4013 domain-containing protein [Cyanobacteria bacterium TGS_CYA1]